MEKIYQIRRIYTKKTSFHNATEMPINRHKCWVFKEISEMIKVLFICHGNICRSTMAESIMTYLVKQAGVEDQFYINSAATSCEEIGNPPHSGTVAKLKAEGIPVIPHRAVQMTLNDYEEYDYLIGMDTENIRNMQRLSGGDPDEKVYKLMTFADSGSDVADPWYTGDFEATYKDVRKGCGGLLKVLMNF